MAGSWDLPQDFERAGSVAFNISPCDEKDHDRICRLIGAGGCCPTHDALEV